MPSKFSLPASRHMSRPVSQMSLFLTCCLFLPSQVVLVHVLGRLLFGPPFEGQQPLTSVWTLLALEFLPVIGKQSLITKRLVGCLSCRGSSNRSEMAGGFNLLIWRNLTLCCICILQEWYSIMPKSQHKHGLATVIYSGIAMQATSPCQSLRAPLSWRRRICPN